MKRILQVGLSLLLAGIIVGSYPGLARAQSGTETRTDTITVTGTLENPNAPGKTPEGLEVMLHSWDQSDAEKPMLHANSLADGSFRFENVPVEPGLTFGTMVSYEDGIYASDPATLESGKTSLEFKIQIHESTTDASQVKVDRVHVLFSFSEAGMEVREMNLLSNMGLLTVKDAVTLENGKTAALRFALPKDVRTVGIEPNEENRFIILTDGFADTQPLVPGEQSRQFVASFMQPYNDPLTFTYQATYPVDQVNFMIPASAGVSLSGDGLVSSQPITMSSGESVLLYQADNVKAGQNVVVTFSGKPKIDASSGAAASSATPPQNEFTLPVAIAAGTLSLGLIAGGVWLWRRKKEEAEEEDDVDVGTRDPLNIKLTEIALLDQLHEQGDVEEEIYRSKRAVLLDQAKDLLKPEGTSKAARSEDD